MDFPEIISPFADNFYFESPFQNNNFEDGGGNGNGGKKDVIATKKTSSISNKISETNYAYTYSILPYVNTEDLIKSFDNAPKILEYEMHIYIEQDTVEASNFFGTFCLINLGAQYKNLLLRAVNGQNIEVNTYYHEEFINTWTSFKDVLYFFDIILNEKKKLDISMYYFSLVLKDKLGKINNGSDNNPMILLELGSKLVSNGIRSAADFLTEIKFTEKDYNPTLQSNNISDFELSDISEKIADFIPQNIIDNFNSVSAKIKEVLTDALPPKIKELINKFVGLVNEIITKFKEIIAVIQQISDLLKAFLMGVINGLISIISLILNIVAWLIDLAVTILNPTKIFNAKKYIEIQKTLEIIENSWDFLSTNASKFIDGIATMIKTFDFTAINNFITKLGKSLAQKVKGINRYDIAYYLGAFTFEVVLSVVLALFTGGVSLIAQASTKAQKLLALMRIVLRETFATATLGIVDIFRLFKALFTKLIIKFAEGFTKFLEWLGELFGKSGDNLFGELDELAEIPDQIDYLSKWDELPISGKGFLGGKVLRRADIKLWIQKVNKISNGKSKIILLPKNHKLLKGNRAGFNPFNGDIYVQKGMTEYEIFHEYHHLEEYIKLGQKEYIKGMAAIGGSLYDDAIRTYKREKNVYEQILKNKNRFSDTEFKHAKAIFDKEIIACKKAGIDINKIK
jgi:Metallopeptidase toxin 4